MTTPIPPVVQFAVIVAGGTVMAVGLAARIFLSAQGVIGIGKEFLTEDWKYLGIAWLVTQAVNRLAKYNTAATYTDLIYDIEGETVAIFQLWTHPLLTLFFTAVYFVAFPTVVLFTYYAVKANSKRQARRYVVGYLCLVGLATPFFIFFPVAVAAARADVLPLIYDIHPIVVAGTLSTDTLLKAFPSLHTGLSVLAILYARKATTAYFHSAVLIGILVIISTFYGGIHWISDAAFAAVLAGVAYVLSQRVPIDWAVE